MVHIPWKGLSTVCITLISIIYTCYNILAPPLPHPCTMLIQQFQLTDGFSWLQLRTRCIAYTQTTKAAKENTFIYRSGQLLQSQFTLTLNLWNATKYIFLKAHWGNLISPLFRNYNYLVLVSKWCILPKLWMSNMFLNWFNQPLYIRLL